MIHTQPQPPSYSETFGLPSHPELDQPNFCWKCGVRFGSEKLPIHCFSCGTPTNASNSSYANPITQQPSNEAFGGGSSNGIQLTLHTIISNRLVIDFEKVSCCPWEHVGLHDGVKGSMPQEIASKGISPQLWKEWMEKLQDIQKLAPSVAGCLCMFCFPGFLPQSILCAMFCPISSNHPFSFLPCCYGDWYDKLNKWQIKVNETLNRYEMHAKLMTYKPHNGAPRSKLYSQRVAGKDHNYEMSFLVIALTKEESEKLILESWDHGVNDKCTSGIGRCL